ncbi:MAG TPA: neutral/alkaline non-lysosomal ceramidase N-terminal domain-containing protein [Phnomibacter sp.]|nr:neutral/alkaline non-lysosomal ceramidase N-terminal domain-containing protein [Phnomibacter sp.]
MPADRSIQLLIVVSLSVLFATSCQPAASSSGLMAGASVKNITPAAGVFIAGHGYGRQATGIHDPLYAKALVVSDGHKNLTIVSIDCIGLLHPALVEIRKAVAALLPGEIDTAQMVMTSTHTHSGPDVVGLWGAHALSSGVDSIYMEKLVQLSAEAVVEAWSNRKAATIRYGLGQHGEGWVHNISNPEAVDRSLQVIWFTDAAGRSIATLTNFACHPTIMDAATSLFSADYLQGLYTHLDEKLGGVNLFLQGAIGGWVQPEHEEKTFAVAEQRGIEIGTRIEELLAEAASMNAPVIQYRRRYISLPVTNAGFLALSKAGVIPRQISDSVVTEIAWFSIGDASFATHPGETTPVHGLQTKALMKNNGPRMVIGLGMDALGYILSEEFLTTTPPLPHTEYLLSMSIHPQAGSLLMQRIKELAADGQN